MGRVYNYSGRGVATAGLEATQKVLAMLWLYSPRRQCALHEWNRLMGFR
jgi:hypothetical protein